MINVGAVLDIPSGGFLIFLLVEPPLLSLVAVFWLYLLAMETIGATDYSSKTSQQKKLNEQVATDKLEMTALKGIKWRRVSGSFLVVAVVSLLRATRQLFSVKCGCIPGALALEEESYSY